MGVQFNIKDVEVVELVADIARRMGVSKTEAVRQAVRAQHRKLTAEERLAKVRALVKGMRDHWPKETLEASDPSAFLYDDETGLPA